VVAVGFAETTEARMLEAEESSIPIQGTEIVVVAAFCATAKPRSVDRMSVETMMKKQSSLATRLFWILKVLN
jgi:hypothetical protein